jgi:hypothetical protein
MEWRRDATSKSRPKIAIPHVCVQGYFFAGLENRDDCYCGGTDELYGDYARLGTATNCNMTCEEFGIDNCGGSRAISVYKVDIISSECGMYY